MKYAFNTFKCKLNVSVQLLTKMHLICGIVLYQYHFKLSSGGLWWHVSIRSCSAGALLLGLSGLRWIQPSSVSHLTESSPRGDVLRVFPFSVSFATLLATLLFHSLLLSRRSHVPFLHPDTVSVVPFGSLSPSRSGSTCVLWDIS